MDEQPKRTFRLADGIAEPMTFAEFAIGGPVSPGQLIELRVPAGWGCPHLVEVPGGTIGLPPIGDIAAPQPDPSAPPEPEPAAPDSAGISYTQTEPAEGPPEHTEVG